MAGGAGMPSTQSYRFGAALALYNPISPGLALSYYYFYLFFYYIFLLSASDTGLMLDQITMWLHITMSYYSWTYRLLVLPSAHHTPSLCMFLCAK